MIASFIFIFSCKEKNTPIKPNHCTGLHPISADFHIYEILNAPDGWVNYDTDTKSRGY